MNATIPHGAALSLALLERAYGRVFTAAQKANAQSVIDALTSYGDRFGLLQPHRLVQYLAQLMHESGGFRYDREVWGPTPAQKRYEGRKDLGNTQKGDGSRFRGHGPGQVTGRANHRAFSKWAKQIEPDAPNFESHPEKVNSEPWGIIRWKGCSGRFGYCTPCRLVVGQEQHRQLHDYSQPRQFHLQRRRVYLWRKRLCLQYKCRNKFIRRIDPEWGVQLRRFSFFVRGFSVSHHDPLRRVES